MHRVSKVIYTWTHRSNWAHAGVWWGPRKRPAWKLSYSCTEDSNKLSGRRKKTVDGCGAWGSSGWKDQATRPQGLHGPTSNAKHHIFLMTFKVIKSLKSQYLDLDQSKHIFGCSMFQSILASAPRSTASTEF